MKRRGRIHSGRAFPAYSGPGPCVMPLRGSVQPRFASPNPFGLRSLTQNRIIDRCSAIKNYPFPIKSSSTTTEGKSPAVQANCRRTRSAIFLCRTPKNPSRFYRSICRPLPERTSSKPCPALDFQVSHKVIPN